MTVSVIVRTYNRADLLMSRAIPSVLRQTDPDWECHVIGDGTDEETRDAMAPLVAVDGRWRFTNLKRQQYPEGSRWAYWGLLGLEALNYGLDTVRGEWVAVLDDDDEFTDDHNATLLAAAEDDDFVYGVSASPSGQRWGSWPPGDGALTQGSYIYRRTALEFRYDLNCLRDRALNGDADMWTRMYQSGVPFKKINKVVHRYYPSAERGGA